MSITEEEQTVVVSAPQGFMTFSVYEALHRLVSRYPSLSLNPDISALLSKGERLNLEEVMGIFAEIFVQPDITVSAAGCFRPYLLKLVNSLVDTLSQMRSSRNCTDSEYEIYDAHDFSRNKWNQQNCWSMKLHEYVIIAFSRSLELVPVLLRPIQKYFSFAPRPFERLMSYDGAKEKTEKETLHLLDIVRASYRLLQLEPRVFSKLWDWSPFLELLKWPCKSITENLPDIAYDLRWCAVRSVSLVLKLSDEATRDIGYKISGLTEDLFFTCLLRWEEFCQDVAVEKAAWYLESVELKKDPLDSLIEPDFCESAVDSKSNASGLVNYIESFGIEISRIKDIKNKRSCFSIGSFVVTPNIMKKIQAITLGISQRHSILLEGPTGVGKTALIDMLAHFIGRSDILFIHLDDQVDSKSLVGSYVCTEIPGEFKWQPGSLTQAALRGFWVVLEEIDNASPDVLSILSSLLEDKKLHIPGRAEALSAADGFQLFATVTKDHGLPKHGSSGWDSFNNLWKKVSIEAPSSDDLIEIIKGCYPGLVLVSSKLIETVDMLNTLTKGTYSKLGGGNTAFRSHRISTRDLMKWCNRIKDISFFSEKDFPLPTKDFPLPSHVREQIFYEAVDLFAVATSQKDSRKFLMEKLAEFWEISHSQIQFLTELHKPQLQDKQFVLHVGRALLQVHEMKDEQMNTRPFIYTGSALRYLERIACSVQHNEPVLLVGETGTGKTTLVQHLALRIGVPLTVLNLSQQSDSTDLLGGFKPVDAKSVCIPLINSFVSLVTSTFSKNKNKKLLEAVQRFLDKKKWDKLLETLQHAVKKVLEMENSEGQQKGENSTNKKKKVIDKEIWKAFSLNVEKAQRQFEASKTSLAFTFIEGALIKAMRGGQWILLDEINLAPPETLKRLSGLLGGEGSLCLTEKGDIDPIECNSNFRIFACMNPATDVGKPELPFNIKNRFTEFFIDDLINKEDLSLIVNQYLEGLLPSIPVDDIVTFYREAKSMSETRLFDGANQKPQYSLRSLTRSLEYTRAATPIYGFHRALYDGVSMLFLTLLDRESSIIMESLISKILFKEDVSLNASKHKHLFKDPSCPGPDYLQVEQYFVEKGSYKDSKVAIDTRNKYVLTKSIKEHLKNLARAVFIRRHPVLLQGPTSSGKTSMIEHLATITGHRFVRINNHEHTDLQEYLGSYITDASGKIVFQEGILVEALRNGYWIVLDELNLAPTDVLEALNRLLDDNRELFIPELLTTVKPHPHFMLFATQNPPGIYGGRKALSRAFRNRFLEIHVDDIPEDELCIILEKRCEIPASYASKMVEIMKDLQRHRQSSKAFAGKHGFITPRDLFRWAERFRSYGKSYDDLAIDGYMLLAERLREEHEKVVVQGIIEKHLRVKINLSNLYSEDSSRWKEVKNLAASSEVLESVGKIIWTKSLRRLFHLVYRCYLYREPVLLVGETGTGKTTVCQLLSLIVNCHLHIINCHQHTESSDFLGGYRPVRDRKIMAEKYQKLIKILMESVLFTRFLNGQELSPSIEDAGSTLTKIRDVIGDVKDNILSLKKSSSKEELNFLEKRKQELSHLQRDWQSLFVWNDGPLVEAMKNGHFLLIDEISLADDSVLERLNSVLEPSRLLVLPEKGGPVLEELTANPNFFLLATMNPGGDFGKKELSPALRNRFTEIYVPAVAHIDDLRSIVLNRFSTRDLHYLADPLLNFWKWFQDMETGCVLTVRDLLSWITFINITERNIGRNASFLHGAFLILLDGLCNVKSSTSMEKLRETCFNFLQSQLPSNETISNDYFKELLPGKDNPQKTICQLDDMIGIKPFLIKKGSHKEEGIKYELSAPTTSKNVLRILRAMQLQKPVLLEGSPGVGKTSLIAALANLSGHSLVRINLSEQTDIMDLLGTDLPVEGSYAIEFQWSDGILLQALKSGHWVVLDELNLASQSVLEGLNAILDHRGEVYIPELGKKFKSPDSFRVFACQNPSSQGGGRKGLPKSFLNRFTKVFVDELYEDDYLFISSALYPLIPREFLSKLITFNSRLYNDTMIHCKYGQSGSPWEFNLRDLLRCCRLIEGVNSYSKETCFLNVVYLQRMRSPEDRCQVMKLYQEVFGITANINPYPNVKITPNTFSIGTSSLPRDAFTSGNNLMNNLELLPGFSNAMESVMHCVNEGWMCILVGPSSSGKTSLIRVLAELTGNKLHEYNLSEGTDTSELLGCFEQFDSFRCLQDVILQVHNLIVQFCAACLRAPVEVLSADHSIAIVKNLMDRWATFQKSLNINDCQLASSLHAAVDANKESISDQSFELLLDIINHLKHEVRTRAVSVTWSFSDMENIVKMLGRIKENLNKKESAGHFEWLNGGLIKALENGEWVMLENANLCNPTVLDRLNSLLEPDGSIIVNERGLVNGLPFVISAHSKFRLFLTVNPAYGEVSRAMRNRGIEICLMHPNWPVALRNDSLELQNYDIDPKRLLILQGIPVPNLVEAMTNAHCCLAKELSGMGFTVSLRELSDWAQVFLQLLIRGSNILWSLYQSWEHAYLHKIDRPEAKTVACSIMKERLMNIKLIDSTSCSNLCFCLPGGWPFPLRLNKYLRFSTESIVERDCAYLKMLGAQYVSFKLGKELKTICRKLNKDGSRVNLSSFNSDFGLVQLLPSYALRSLLFPSSEPLKDINDRDIPVLDVDLLDKMLYFAGKWILEKASLYDVRLRLQWLKWNGEKLVPYCRYFIDYCLVLEKAMRHPVAERLFSFLKEHELDLFGLSNFEPLQCVSSLSNTLLPSSEHIILARKAHEQLIYCFLLLIDSMWQWKIDEFLSQSDWFTPVVTQLREVENELLIKASDMKYANITFREYLQSLQESHQAFTKAAYNPIFNQDICIICLQKLNKVVKKIESYVVHNSDDTQIFISFHHAKRNLEIAMSSSSSFGKPLLWKHGGQPAAASSANHFQRQKQLLDFCKSIWQTGNLQKQLVETGNKSMVETAVSRNFGFRFLVMQGLAIAYCMDIDSPYGPQEEAIRECDDILRLLSERFDIEKSALEKELSTKSKKMKVFQSNGKVFNAAELNVDHLEDCFSQESYEIFVIENLWTELLPFLNHKCLYMDFMLLESVTECLLPFGTLHCPKGMEESLRKAMAFGMKLSPRPPLDFIPHQNLLWLIEAHASNGIDDVKFSSAVHEMWYRWHTNLWTLEHNNQGKHSSNTLQGAGYLFGASQTLHLMTILKGPMPFIKDHKSKLLQFQGVSTQFWKCFIHAGSLYHSVFSILSGLFKQIILIYCKSLKKDDAKFTKKLITDLHEKLLKGDNVDLHAVDNLLVLLGMSNHKIFRESIALFVRPLIQNLYSCISDMKSQPFPLYKLAGCWLLLGELRLRLLVGSNDMDPAMKNRYKCSELSEKVDQLELEIKVREESEKLSRGSSLYAVSQGKLSELVNLKDKRNDYARKMIYRPEPSKFRDLYRECCEFIKSVGNHSKLSSFISNLESGTLDACIKFAELQNWQDISSSFVNRLSDEYDAYKDIIQPIQLAIYEIKFGLSLAMKAYHEIHSPEKIVEIICSAMEFPTAINTESDIEYNSHFSKLLTLVKEIPVITHPVADKKVSNMQLSIKILRFFLLRACNRILQSLVLNSSSMQMLNSIFSKLTSLWMEMKEQIRGKADHDAQSFHFKPRDFKIEDDLEINESTFRKLLIKDVWESEWDSETNMEHEDKFSQPQSDQSELETVWNSIEEQLLQDVIKMQFLLFGQPNLAHVDHSQMVRLSNNERIHAFSVAYDVGSKFVEGNDHLLPSVLDAKIMSGHLLNLCLEHRKFSQPPQARFNIYKDSNTYEMALMIEPLLKLQDRVSDLLSEYPENPVLQKISEIIGSLKDIPLDAPLMKALIGVQYLVYRLHAWDENVRKTDRLSDEVSLLLSLLNRWRRIEFESWSTLLDAVDQQHQINADKLWFALYSVLYRKFPEINLEEEISSTIGSIEEFLQTSSVGEFKERLLLLLMFHGQISAQIKLETYPDLLGNNMSTLEDELKLGKTESTRHQSRDILVKLEQVTYNVIGYYIQFLPLVIKSIEVGRQVIEKELKDYSELCKWDRHDYYSIEAAKKRHQKLQKFIQKYNDILQQPIIGIVNQELMKIGAGNFDTSVFKLLDCSEDKDDQKEADISHRILHDRWQQYSEIQLKSIGEISFLIGSGAKNLCSQNLTEHADNLQSFISNSIFSTEAISLRWEGYKSFENFRANIVDRARDLRKDNVKRSIKKTAFTHLLGELEKIGLSRYKSDIPKEERDTRKWFLQPCYKMTHLLYKENLGTCKAFLLDENNETVVPISDESIVCWKSANEYYFKNMTVMQKLRQIALSFHKDLTLREVEISMSFLEYLLYLQRKQRSIAYDFFLKLERLSEVIVSLKGCVDICSSGKVALSHHQQLVSECILEQKNFIDCLCNALAETSLLLKNMELMHNTPTPLNDEIRKLQETLEKFRPACETFKDFLNDNILKSHGVITASYGQCQPIIITKEMEDILYQIQHVTKDMQSCISSLLNDTTEGHYQIPLLANLSNLLNMGLTLSEKFSLRKGSLGSSDVVEELKTTFFDSYNKSTLEVLSTVQKLTTLQSVHSRESLVDWVCNFERQMADFCLDNIYTSLTKTVNALVNLLDNRAEDSAELFQSGERMLIGLIVFVDMVVNAGNAVLTDYVKIHNEVAKMHYTLSNILASLFVEGFFVSEEDSKDEGGNLKFEDTAGTGMGEGEGVKDVSEQIEDEDQLLGTSDQASEEPSDSQKVGRESDKGIEMQEDFNTSDMVDLSENSNSDSGDEDEEMDIDSQMGKTGDAEKVIDEQVPRKDEDLQTDDTIEKYETGASVQESQSDSLEFRAKQDTNDDEKVGQNENNDGPSDENDNATEDRQNAENENGTPEESVLDKEDAYTDPTGVQPQVDENVQQPEDMEVEEMELESDMKEQSGSDEQDNANGNSNDEMENEDVEDMGMDIDNQPPEAGDELPGEDSIKNSQMKYDNSNNFQQSRNFEESSQNNPNGAGANAGAPCSQEFSKPDFEKMASNLENESAGKVDASKLENENAPPDINDTMTSPFAGMASELPSSNILDGMGHSSGCETELNSLNNDASSNERMDANPFRSVGDSLKKWKERVKLLDVKSENQDEIGNSSDMEEIERDDGSEFQFVSEKEKSSSQALGAATADQLKSDLNVDKNNPMQEDYNNDEAEPSASHQFDNSMEDEAMAKHDIENSIFRNKKMEKEKTKMAGDFSARSDQEPNNDTHTECSQKEDDRTSLLSLKRPDQSLDVDLDMQYADSVDEWTEEDIRKMRRDIHSTLREGGDNRNATVLWSKYERLTARLSQDLAEQLRLIMEPTLASRLQGDYQTGKRINMKKIIPYIASHFRKDKIWLRRTKPNKRQYQVVLAIDDSRSMSESNCGQMALEALITICRGLSQLEVGQLAVASFGRKGNINMLHDFDQPFTSEAGVKMISKFSFRQDNTIEDEPVVDLIKYLTTLLDHAAMSSRGFFGHVNVQQLVLIIADGRFHEKENLRRRVRDAMSRNQLLAFIVLDNAEESILDVQSVLFDEGGPKFSKYLDSFPFPYYIILKDIEALPRALADLLRQWFELTRYASM